LILPDTLLVITGKYLGIILQLKESINSLNIDNPVEIEKAYLTLKKRYKNQGGEINFWLKSERTSIWFMFSYHRKEDFKEMIDDCEA
jgi:hypothetical protein